jgi:hypothetical protein
VRSEVIHGGCFAKHTSDSVVGGDLVVGLLALREVLLPLDGDGRAEGLAVKKGDDDGLAGFDGGRHLEWTLEKVGRDGLRVCLV